MPDSSPSTLTVLNSNFLQLGRSGGRPQRTVYPGRLPVSCDTYTRTLAGIEPNLPIVSPTRYTTATETTEPITGNENVKIGFRTQSCLKGVDAFIHLCTDWLVRCNVTNKHIYCSHEIMTQCRVK